MSDPIWWCPDCDERWLGEATPPVSHSAPLVFRGTKRPTNLQITAGIACGGIFIDLVAEHKQKRK